MDKYAAIDKYEDQIKGLEIKRGIVRSTILDKDVALHSRERVLKDIADIDGRVAIYIDVIETISSLE